MVRCESVRNRARRDERSGREKSADAVAAPACIRSMPPAPSPICADGMAERSCLPELDRLMRSGRNAACSRSCRIAMPRLMQSVALCAQHGPRRQKRRWRAAVDSGAVREVLRPDDRARGLLHRASAQRLRCALFAAGVTFVLASDERHPLASESRLKWKSHNNRRRKLNFGAEFFRGLLGLAQDRLPRSSADRPARSR